MTTIVLSKTVKRMAIRYRKLNKEFINRLVKYLSGIILRSEKKRSTGLIPLWERLSVPEL